MAAKDLIPFYKRSEEEQNRIRSMGGKKSVEVRRKKKDLKERFRIGLEAWTELKADKFKAAGDNEKAKLIKEIGVEVFGLLSIATDESLLTDQRTRLAAWNDILDRVEGKPLQTSVIDASISDVTEISEEEKKLIDALIKKEAKKMKNN